MWDLKYTWSVTTEYMNNPEEVSKQHPTCQNVLRVPCSIHWDLGWHQDTERGQRWELCWWHNLLAVSGQEKNLLIDSIFPTCLSNKSCFIFMMKLDMPNRQTIVFIIYTSVHWSLCRKKCKETEKCQSSSFPTPTITECSIALHFWDNERLSSTVTVNHSQNNQFNPLKMVSAVV